MTNLSKLLLTTIMVAGVVLVPWMAGSSLGNPFRQPPKSAEQSFNHSLLTTQPLPKPSKLYFGALACSNGGCHNSPINKQDIILCGYDEVEIWAKHDKHKDANRVLKGERGRQMAKLLGIKGDISHEASCISCHGVLVEVEKLKHNSFHLEDGVSCAACHGFYEEWVSKHADFLKREQWRTLSRVVKEEQYGMKDLWDPEKRATLCASCHIGNTAEKKVVTHAMYAAGHPPLPGIELATFSDAMPRHWKYLAEKRPEVQKIMGYDPATSSLERTQLVVIAGVVSFRESLNLLAAQAAEGDKNWPEIAQFDCYACHHDLKTKSWRQQRGYTGKPGRPEMRPWPTALIEAGILQASGGDPVRHKDLSAGFRTHMKDLAAVFHAQPFGEPKQVAKAAQQMSHWTDELLAKLKTSKFDHAAAHKIVHLLGKEAQGRLIDFDSARQIAWAFRSIQDELDAGFLKKHMGLFKELDSQLQLDLPPGQVEIARDFLRETLEKLSNFEPERFSNAFGQLLQKVEQRTK